MSEHYEIQGKTYSLIRLLGHGKGGYSYLAESDGTFFVLKKIHHEPCDYYQFGDKFQAELSDYQRLFTLGINLPRLIAFDTAQEILVKEYIEGSTVAQVIEENQLRPWHIEAVLRMQEKCKAKGLNIDYYPTNFIVSGDALYYIDYECNTYDPQWDFDHWGVRYWKLPGKE